MNAFELVQRTTTRSYLASASGNWAATQGMPKIPGIVDPDYIRSRQLPKVRFDEGKNNYYIDYVYK